MTNLWRKTSLTKLSSSPINLQRDINIWSYADMHACNKPIIINSLLTKCKMQNQNRLKLAFWRNYEETSPRSPLSPASLSRASSLSLLSLLSLLSGERRAASAVTGEWWGRKAMSWIQFNSIQLNSLRFNSILFNSVLFEHRREEARSIQVPPAALFPNSIQFVNSFIH